MSDTEDISEDADSFIHACYANLAAKPSVRLHVRLEDHPTQALHEEIKRRARLESQRLIEQRERCFPLLAAFLQDTPGMAAYLHVDDLSWVDPRDYRIRLLIDHDPVKDL